MVVNRCCTKKSALSEGMEYRVQVLKIIWGLLTFINYPIEHVNLPRYKSHLTLRFDNSRYATLK